MKVNIPLLTEDGRIRIYWSPDGSGPEKQDACIHCANPEFYELYCHLVPVAAWEEFEAAQKVYFEAKKKLWATSAQSIPLDAREIAALKESLIEQLYPEADEDPTDSHVAYRIKSTKRDLLYSSLAPDIYGKEFVDEHRQKPPASDGPTLELDDETVERLRAISESDLPPDGDYI